MGRGTNRHAGLIVTVILDICETWKICEVASPQAGVQGREGAIRVKTSKLDLLLIGLYPPPLGGWATDKVFDLAEKWYTPHRPDAAWWSEVTRTRMLDTCDIRNETH